MGNLCIDLSERTVTWRGQAVELSSGEYNLLVVLARHAGEVLSRDQILQRLRGIEFNGTDRSVDVAISKLRRKFDDHAAKRARSRPCGARATCSAVPSGNAEPCSNPAPVPGDHRLLQRGDLSGAGLVINCSNDRSWLQPRPVPRHADVDRQAVPAGAGGAWPQVSRNWT
jgi:hypothetical protein